MFQWFFVTLARGWSWSWCFFPVLFMFKALDCSISFVCLCIAFPFLSFQISAALLRFKTSRVERIPWFFLYFIFLLSHRLSGCFRFIFQNIELFEFSLLKQLLRCFYCRFKLLLVVAFQWRLAFSAVAAIVFSQNWKMFFISDNKNFF